MANTAMANGSGERRDDNILLAFQVITDTHVRADARHTYNVNLEKALQDIATHARERRGDACR